MKTVAILLVVVVAIFLLMRQRGGRAKLSAADAQALLAQGARLVDVRSPGEFASGHLQGAVNIPVQQIGQRLGELEPRDKPVVLYCASGMRSATAAAQLKRAGFVSVHDIGSMAGWPLR